MRAEQVRDMLLRELAGCEVSVSGQDSHYDILVVGAAFAGLSQVKRQQMVYAALKEPIADGRIHAVKIRAVTPAERQPG